MGNKWRPVVNDGIEFARVGAGLLAGLIMVALFAVGFWEIVRPLAALTGFGSATNNLSPMAALVACLKGLEFMFIAPLPYLTFIGVDTYVREFRRRPPGVPLRADLTPVKSLIVSLMIAIIATDAVSRVVGTEPLTYEAATTRFVLIVALTIYYATLHWTAAHSSDGSYTDD